MVRWRENGSNRGRRFDRKGDADAWERALRRRRQLGPLALAQLTTRAPTLGDWIAERWAPEHPAPLEQSTRGRYADVYRLHVEPWLGDLPLTEITVGRLRSWQAERLADGVGVGTIDKARTVLSSVLRHAAESEAIPGNPLALVRAPLAEHRDGVTPLAPVTVESIRTVLTGAMDIHVPERIRRGGVRVAGYVVSDERHVSATRRWCRCSPTPACGPASCARCDGATCARPRSPSSAPRAPTARSRAPRTTSAAPCACSRRSRPTSPSCVSLPAARPARCSCSP